MTCTECVRLVATAGVAELTAAGAVMEHCRTCGDCATLVDEVAEESRRLAGLLDGTPSGVPPHVVALRAVAGAARGRRRARRLRVSLSVGAATAALLAAVALLRAPTPAGAGSHEVRTVELRCLAPAQAAELARPYLPSQVSVVMRPGVRLPILTLSGTHRDLETAEIVITQLDAKWGAERSSYCGADAPSAHAPNANAPEAGPAPERPPYR